MRLRKLGPGAIILGLFTALSLPAQEPVSSFQEKGVIVDIHHFFAAANDALKEPFSVEEETVAGRALVTNSGVYAFLETPENESRLKDVALGTAVRVTGKLLLSGSLLQIDELKAIRRDPGVDLDKFKSDPGHKVTLTGANKCQCGLKVKSLESSCKLGHLHHLEASDGKIYNYLQYGQAKDLFLGHGYHFKNVEISAIELPGHYLLVEEVELKQ